MLLPSLLHGSELGMSEDAWKWVKCSENELLNKYTVYGNKNDCGLKISGAINLNVECWDDPKEGIKEDQITNKYVKKKNEWVELTLWIDGTVLHIPEKVEKLG